MRPETYEYDIETYKELLLFCFQNHYNDDIILFEISKNVNQLDDLINFLSNSYKRIVTFNGVHFDSLITNYIVKNYSELKKLNNMDLITHIYNVSQEVINNDYHKYYEYRKHTLYQEIDLFLLVSKGLRISKKLSLKFYAYNLDMDIMEMPVPHNKTNLTDEEIELVKQYVKQDVNVTKSLALHKQKEINLRLWIKQNYDLDCLCSDAPKIASELLLKSYCNLTYDEKSGETYSGYKYTVKNRRYEKPNNIKLGDFLPKIQFKTKQFSDLYKRICNSYNTFNEELVVRNPNNTNFKLTVSVGGIHSQNSNEKYVSDSNSKIYTIDIGSMYPTNIENYGYISPELGTPMLSVYSNIKKQRFEAKKNKEEVKDSFLKLTLNAVSGQLDSSFSWLYSPEQALGLRLTGQLQLCKMIEYLHEIGVNIISCNTDGIECIVENNQEELFYQCLEVHSKEFNLIWEYKIYDFIYYKTVNDYIAVTNEGDVKVKGEFIYKKQLEGSNEFLIIPLAIKEFYINNIPIEETIKNHTNVFDFCFGKKISKDYEVFYQGKKIQQLNRIFVSKKGAYLYKRKKNKTTFENVLKDTPVCIYNTPDNKTPKELNVDFDWYIKKTKEKLMELDNNNQLTLF